MTHGARQKRPTLARSFRIAIACFAVAACGSVDQVSGNDVPGETSAVADEDVPQEWGAILMSLVGDRTNQSPPTIDQVKRAFSAACEFGSGDGAVSALCKPVGVVDAAPQSFRDLRLQLLNQGPEVRAVRMTACCGSDLPDPLATQSVIRAEKLCPEITLVASQSAHVFRVSAPGKRDFVLGTIGHADGENRSTSHTLLLTPAEDGSECADLIAAEKDLGPTP